MISLTDSAAPGADVMIHPTPGADWRRGELISRLVATLDFAQQASAHLLTAPESDTTDDDASPAFLRRAKFVCETALLLHLASKVPNPPRRLTSRIDELATVLAPHARDEKTALWMRLRPAMAAELGVAHLCLTTLGHPDQRFHEEYCAALSSTSVGPAERMAWKDLEAAWHRELGAPLPELDLDAATRRTAYNQGQDVISASREACYAVTHGLIYASGFGAHRPALVRAEPELLADIDAMTARCLDEDDFDLGAEVLLTWPLIRGTWSPTATFSLRVLDHVTEAFGILPSMTLRSSTCAELDPAAQARYYFRESYHTEYVWGLLMAAILRTARPVPQRPAPAPPGRGAIADRLIGLLPPRSPEPQWLDVLAATEPDERGALVPLLADVGVRRAVLAKDFARAHEIVLTFLEAEAPPTSMIIQAGELLTRLARSADLAA
ncbi:DUF6895 family protein [Nesterenkonia suensis]